MDETHNNNKKSYSYLYLLKNMVLQAGNKKKSKLLNLQRAELDEVVKIMIMEEVWTKKNSQNFDMEFTRNLMRGLSNQNVLHT